MHTQSYQHRGTSASDMYHLDAFTKYVHASLQVIPLEGLVESDVHSFIRTVYTQLYIVGRTSIQYPAL